MANQAERAQSIERLEGPLDDSAETHLRRELERTWYVPRGLIGWFCVVDHRTIGKRYIATAFGFFIAAGILAALMRIQLSGPNNTFLGPDRYNQIFTMHGTTMMFLFAVPVMEAMAVFLVPLMVGTRNIAFPRMNAYAYWIYLAGGVMVYVALFGNVDEAFRRHGGHGYRTLMGRAGIVGVS